MCVCVDCRILWSFKLNPYERLNLRFTATPEEIRRQYRKLSLMVHPDKCKHPQAAEAFDSEYCFGGGEGQRHMAERAKGRWGRESGLLLAAPPTGVVRSC